MTNTNPYDDDWMHRRSERDYESSQNAGSAGGPCFIATAAYDSPLDARIDIFREWRDVALFPNKIGKTLVGLYYEMGPKFASMIQEHSGLKSVVRKGLNNLVDFYHALKK